jgi:hypothetical protein
MTIDQRTSAQPDALVHGEEGTRREGVVRRKYRVGLGLARRALAGGLALGLISVTVSLAVRLIHRGPYYPGWDLVAPTQGQFLAATRSVWDAVAEAFYQNRHYELPFSLYSVPYSLIPGYLGRLWPSEYWAHVLSLLTFVLTLLVILRVADLPLREAGVLLLGWGASPMLLSLAVTGYPWASAFLPHALALWIATSRRLARHWIATLVCCLLVNELSWHAYELGKTVSVVFFAAALLQPAVPLPVRAVWVVAAALQLTETLFIHPTANVGAFAFQASGGWGIVHPSLPLAVTGMGTVVRAIAGGELDLPVVFVAGVLSFFFFRRNRMLLLVLVLLQLGLVVLLAMYGPQLLRPRRFIMVDCYCLVALACAWREGGPGLRRLLVGALVAGNFWQAYVLYRFTRLPIPRPGIGFTVPYVESGEGVGLVAFSGVDWAQELEARVEAGKRLFLVYNFDCYRESFTNPEALLERLYLALGHERFVRSVFVFGSKACRYSCLPIRPLAALGPFLDGVRPDGPVPPATLTGYFSTSCKGPGTDAAELDTILAEVLRRFRIALESPADQPFVRFRIEAATGATGGS